MEGSSSTSPLLLLILILVSVVLGMRCKNQVDNLAEESIVCHRTLRDIADRPQYALPAVASPPRPRRLERIVDQQAGLVGTRGTGQSTSAAGEAGEKWCLENVNWIRRDEILRLEVVAQVQAALRVIAELHGNQDAQHILRG